MTKRSGITLVFVLASLALAAAVIVPLALLSGTRAVVAAYDADTLRHRLAGDSLIAVLPEWLEHAAEIRAALQRDNRAHLTLAIGAMQIAAQLQDDSAKLPLPALFDRRAPQRLQDALAQLQVARGLPALTIVPAPRSVGCLDDLFFDANDDKLFGRLDAPAWADVLTCVGRRMNLARAAAGILEAGLQDLKPGLGHELERLRRLRPKDATEALLADCDLPQRLQRTALDRLTTSTERYSLLIRTALESDVRWRYVICTANEPPDVIVDWEIAP